MDAVADVDHGVSQFEIKAEYVPTGSPDLLDIYKIKDSEFGIKISNLGGRGRSRQLEFEWSPIMQLD